MSFTTSTQTHPRKVHIVGSIPLASTTDILTRLSTVLPHLTRIPDGEPGTRWNFVVFQLASLPPHIVPPFFRADPTAEVPVPEPGTPLVLGPSTYDVHALESYTEFCRLRREGVIGEGVRFQVCLPMPIDTISVLVLPEYQVEAEKLYEAAILTSLRQIQDAIPASDLAIQWDMPIELCYMEYARFQETGGVEMSDFLVPPYGNVITKPWFPNVREGILSRAARMMNAVDPDVEMGIHLCYGDLGHKHYIEPADTGMLVDFANTLYAGLEAGRKMQWVHMPVPKGRMDEEFFAPLKDLKLGEETELYLGLVHGGDLDGTERRIEAAKSIGREFGVSTECGCGRCTVDDLASILDISRAVTA